MSNTLFLKGVKNELWLSCKAAVRQDDTKPIDVPFKIKFQKPTMRQVKELQRDFQESVTSFDIDRMIEIIGEFILDWEMPGNDGNPVEFCEENLELALDDIDYFNAIANGFADLISGQESQRTKNSRSSGARGPGRR